MCTNLLVLEQWYDKNKKFHCHYYSDYKPEVHTDSFLRRLTLQHFGHRFVVVPCGKCADCIRKSARDWKIRLYHESLSSPSTVFITLTYNDVHLPKDGCLNYRDFQLFIKRVRRHLPNVKLTYFVAGEYGTRTFRPHFHVILYGLPDFLIDDFKFFCVSRSDKRIKIFRSAFLEKYWQFGFVSVSVVQRRDVRAFGYVAGYLISKKNKRHFNQVSSLGLSPEIHRMSLKPCIGRRYFDEYYKDFYYKCDGRCWFDCNLVACPRAYNKWFVNKTQRVVIRNNLLPFDVFNYYFGSNSCATPFEVTSFVMNHLSLSDVTIDKISDFDILKKKWNRSSCSTSTGLNSKDIYISSSLYSSRDIIDMEAFL